MTVFLAIAKNFLIHDIQEIRNQSIQADASLKNTALSWFNKGRDKSLSQAKQVIADQLWQHIQALEDAENDAENYGKIRDSLEAAKKQAADKSKEKHYDEGNFGPAMTRAINFLDEIYKKLGQEGMIDIPYDADPVNLYSFYAASYVVQKLDDKRNEDMVTYLMQHPKLSNIRELAEKKEALLLSKIKDCKEDVDTLDKQHPNFQNARRKRVLDSIEDLLRKNKDLCKEHGIAWEIPVTVTFIASLNIGLPTLRPDNGFMEECMQAAIEAIRESNQHQASASMAI